MSHSVATRAGATLHWVFVLFGSAGRVTVRGVKRRSVTVLLGFVFWLCA